MKKIDVHAHTGKWGFPGRMARDLKQFRREMDVLEIERYVISDGIAVFYDMEEGNKRLFDSIENENGLYGYVVVNGNYIKESLLEIQKYENHKKFVGIKFGPPYCEVHNSSPVMNPIFDYLERNDIPILFHCLGEEEVSTPEGLLEVNNNFPNMKILAGHMGGYEYERAIACAESGNENYLLEICGTNSSVDKIKLAVDAIGKERILFGSDYSLLSAAPDVGRVLDANITDDDREHIFYKNAVRVFERMK